MQVAAALAASSPDADAIGDMAWLFWKIGVASSGGDEAGLVARIALCRLSV